MVVATLILLTANLAVSLSMAWWLHSLIGSLILLVLLAFGALVFYVEQAHSRVVWSVHALYWALSLMNVLGLYMETRASGLLVVLLIINVGGLLRALSRLDAQLAGIVWPVTEAGAGAGAGACSGAGVGSAGSESDKGRQIEPLPEPGFLQEPSFVVEDEPGVQVELETYKNGDNAVPIFPKVRSSELDALMARVSKRLRGGVGKSRKGRASRTIRRR